MREVLSVQNLADLLCKDLLVLPAGVDQLELCQHNFSLIEQQLTAMFDIEAIADAVSLVLFHE